MCRALAKMGYGRERVLEAYAALHEMDMLGFLTFRPTTLMKDEARDLMVDLNLPVSDALSLATRVNHASGLMTEEEHLL